MILSNYAIQDTLILPPVYEGYSPCNTSIVNYNGETLYQTRYVSYVKHFTNEMYNPHGFYSNQHNYDSCGKEYHNTINIRYTDSGYEEVYYGEGLSTLFRGMEDARLTVWDGDLYSYGTRPDLFYDRYVMCLYKGGERLIIDSPLGCKVEKNWMALPNVPYRFIYGFRDRCVMVVDVSGNGSSKLQYIKQNNIKETLTGVRGSTPLVEYGDGYLAVVHKTFVTGGNHYYRHAFIRFDKNLIIQRFSPWFFFHNPLCEFCIGLLVVEGGVKLTYSQLDAFPSEMVISDDVLRKVLQKEDVRGFDNIDIEYFERVSDILYNTGHIKSSQTVANYVLLNKYNSKMLLRYDNDANINKLLKRKYVL